MGAEIYTRESGQDRILDAAHGGYWLRDSAEEELTLSTGGATTDTSANLLPVNSLIFAVDCRVTVTIATATDWAIGDSVTAARFSSANATLAAGTVSSGRNQWRGSVSTDAAGPTQDTAAPVRVTCSGTPSAGKIRIVVKYAQFIPSTS